jgi:hypothetical protein
MLGIRAMVLDALEEMGLKPTSKNILALFKLITDVLKLIESKNSKYVSKESQ